MTVLVLSTIWVGRFIPESVKANQGCTVVYSSYL